MVKSYNGMSDRDRCGDSFDGAYFPTEKSVPRYLKFFYKFEAGLKCKKASHYADVDG